MIVHLNGLLNVVIDLIAWLLIHVCVSLSIDTISRGSFNNGTWLYRERKWENRGRIYHVYSGVKTFKRHLPDGAALLKNRFRKKRLANTDASYIQRFIQETCRAELIHWVILLFSVFFFIWNEWWVWLIMIAYAGAVNVPCIITQRYNRIRLL